MQRAAERISSRATGGLGDASKANETVGRVLAHGSDCVGLCGRQCKGRESRGGGLQAGGRAQQKSVIRGKNGGGYLPYGHAPVFWGGTGPQPALRSGPP